MGLTNTSNRTSKIVTIVRGKFTIRLPEGVDDPNAVERTLEKGANAGKVIKELQYTGIEGVIKGAYVDESDFGTNFVTELEDDEGSRFKLQIPVDSQFFGQYAKRIPNIVKDKALFLGLGYDRERERHFLYAKQEGNKVSMKFTKDEPNDMPPPVQKTVKGKTVWNWEEQENFLYEIAIDFAGSFESAVDKVIETFNAKQTEDIPF
tara:strand:+ start:8365 stop:8982 length:618 start_codon:yes stop_codon:yes gene_type:complete